MISASRKERFIRGLIMLASCTVLSCVAWLAGAYRFADQNLTYACILAIIVASAIFSRFAAKWVMKRL